MSDAKPHSNIKKTGLFLYRLYIKAFSKQRSLHFCFKAATIALVINPYFTYNLVKDGVFSEDLKFIADAIFILAIMVAISSIYNYILRIFELKQRAFSARAKQLAAENEKARLELKVLEDKQRRREDRAKRLYKLAPREKDIMAIFYESGSKVHYFSAKHRLYPNLETLVRAGILTVQGSLDPESAEMFLMRDWAWTVLEEHYEKILPLEKVVQYKVHGLPDSYDESSYIQQKSA
jgi:hypothetical protein